MLGQHLPSDEFAGGIELALRHPEATLVFSDGAWDSTGEPIGEKVDLKPEKAKSAGTGSIDNVFFNEEGDQILVERGFGGGLDYYAFPSGKHELSVRFEFPAKFADAAPSGDLKKVAGRARFDPVVLDLTKALKK